MARRAIIGKAVWGRTRRVARSTAWPAARSWTAVGHARRADAKLRVGRADVEHRAAWPRRAQAVELDFGTARVTRIARAAAEVRKAFTGTAHAAPVGPPARNRRAAQGGQEHDGTHGCITSTSGPDLFRELPATGSMVINSTEAGQRPPARKAHSTADTRLQSRQKGNLRMRDLKWMTLPRGRASRAARFQSEPGNEDAEKLCGRACREGRVITREQEVLDLLGFHTIFDEYGEHQRLLPAEPAGRSAER